MGQIKDLTNQKFGKLTVLKHRGSNKHRSSMWECKCDCGNIKVLSSLILKCGDAMSCGCSQYQSGVNSIFFKDLTGKKFGKLTVINVLPFKHGSLWTCKCDCGNIKNNVKGDSLVRNQVKSCGCIQSTKGYDNRFFKDLTGKIIGKLKVVKFDEQHYLKNSNNQGYYNKWICECVCGKLFSVKAGNIQYTKCCGCLYVGENTSNWNSNLTQQDRLINKNRYLINGMYGWVKSVKKRDSFTCQKCYTKSTKGLHAHHIESFSSNKSISTNINNGITLCKSCHYKFHTMYGNKNNNIHQLNLFLSSNAIIQL